MKYRVGKRCCDGGGEFCLFLLDFFSSGTDEGGWRWGTLRRHACSAGTDVQYSGMLLCELSTVNTAECHAENIFRIVWYFSDIHGILYNGESWTVIVFTCPSLALMSVESPPSHAYPLAEASLPNFNILYREILAFHVKNRENGKTVNFPVATIPCRLHGFSWTQIEVDVTTSLTSKVPLIYRELVSHRILLII